MRTYERFEERYAFQTLTYIFNPGNAKLYSLLEHFGGPVELLKALKRGEVQGIDQETQLKGRYVFDPGFIADEKRCASDGIKLMVCIDRDFPGQLASISQPPLSLYCMGDPAVLSSDRIVTIVGSRRASSYSLTVARRLSYDLAKEGYIIASGFAKGIDTAAHEGAMEAGGQTIAVLGCGIMYDYPRNTMRFKKAISQHGAVVSEYEPRIMSNSVFFKVRNRILSGLSRGVIVIEAGRRSGSLNTVSHALEQGREVMVIPPHDIYDPSYQGNVSLLRDGAVPVCSAQDVIDCLGGQIGFAEGAVLPET